MRSLRGWPGFAAALALACTGGVAAESRERGELHDLQRDIAGARNAALSASNEGDQSHWLAVYDEKTNALNELYEKRSQRLDIEAGGGTPSRQRQAASCKSKIVDGEIETYCR